MVILDTNVLSALMRPDENASALAWLDRQVDPDLWITTISLLEGRYGLMLLPTGRRKDGLTSRFERLVFGELKGKIAPFDKDAAEQAALASVLRRGSNRNTEYHDIQIAGIALARNATLATRNIKDFAGLGIPLINPWDA